MKHFFKVMLALALCGGVCGSLLAQEEVRSYYVRASGNDGNDGRSETAPLKTLARAVERASRGTIKTITIIGQLDATSEGLKLSNFIGGGEPNVKYIFIIQDSGKEEILITGKANASSLERAVLAAPSPTRRDYPGVVIVGGNSKVRFENIEIVGNKGQLQDGRDFPRNGGMEIAGGEVILGIGTKISGNTVDSNTASAVLVNFGTLRMIGGVISDNSYDHIVAKTVVINKGASFTMEGGEIRNNHHSNAAVWVSGSFTMSGGKIYDNRSLGISVRSGGVFTMTGGEISGNTLGSDNYDFGGIGVEPGGGVAVYKNGTFSMSGGKINNNTNRENGGGVLVLGTFTMSGGEISGNIADKGGGVSVGRLRDSDSHGNFTMTGGKISDNKAAKDGGGIFVTYGDIYDNLLTINNFIMKGGEISNNTAGQSGGGIYGYIQEMSGCKINGNKAAANGGGIYINPKRVNDGNMKTSVASVISNGVEIVDNESKWGGGVYIGSTRTTGFSFTWQSGSISGNTAEWGAGVFNEPDTTFVLQNGSINGNRSKTVGGGVYVRGNGVFVQNGGAVTGNIAVDGGENVFRQATVVPAQGDSRSYYVQANGSDNNSGRSEQTPVKTLVKALELAGYGMIKRITVIGTLNKASEEADNFIINSHNSPEILIIGKADAAGVERAMLSGGGNYEKGFVEVSGNIRFELIEISRGGNIIIKGNGTKVVFGDGVKVTGTTGVFVSDGGTFTMDGGTISGNKGGCGVYVESSAVFILNGGAISGNTGGGVYIQRGHIQRRTSDGAYFTDDNADGSFIMNGGEISDNTTASDGGGVYVSGKFTMNNGKISGNRAKYGGGVYIEISNNFTMAGGEISGNQASSGGGVWGNFIISGGSTISGNEASRSGGGVAGSLTMRGGTITNNTAGEQGGGIFGANVLIYGGTITNNTAKKEGGGVYLQHETAESVLSGGEISGNKAAYGAGVYQNGGKLTMKNGSITRNRADFTGGGVFTSPKATLTKTGGTVTGNEAGDGGEDTFKQ
ncbi:MAG: hypothetical protein LBN21_02410 [Treponema sp.]|jgi:hypothetical protein|nr:hypothetical protein [Treponema sp.]